MPQCPTKYHDGRNYDERVAVDFPQGLFGFETQIPVDLTTRIAAPDFCAKPPDTRLCFISLPAFVIDRKHVITQTGGSGDSGPPVYRQPAIGTEPVCLVFVSIHQGGSNTCNLLAPVVVNRQNSRCIQAFSRNQTQQLQTPLRSPNEELGRL